MREAYIYLDWNVVKYIKESDKDEKFISAIEWLKPRFKFPFSFAQLCDRQRGEEKFIREDLHFLSELSEGYMVGTDDENDLYDIAYQDVFEKYKEVKENKEKVYPKIQVDTCARKVILEKGFEHFFQDKQNAYMLYPVLLAALNRFDSDFELYMKFREYMIQQAERHMKRNSIIDKIVKEEFSPSDITGFINDITEFNGGKSLSRHRNMLYLYLLLEFKRTYEGYRIYDKISCKNNFTNIYTDAMHMNVAQYAECFVTNDKTTLRKAEFVYQSFGISTKVVDIKTFIEKVARKL